jgi:hypothetical protein
VAWLSVSAGRPRLDGLRWGRVRAAFEGMGLLATLVVLTSLDLVLALDAPYYEQYASFRQGADFVLSSLPAVLRPYLIPLPLAVIAFNLLPSEGWRHLLSLLGIAGGYAALSLMISLPGLQPPLEMVYIVVAICTVQEFRHRARRSADDLMMQQINAANLDSRLTEARLQLLQAQIEPHFLFNTLANIRRLAQHDPAGGALMLNLLIRYIEAALPRLRAEQSTLADERTLIEAYLSLHQIRMGARLSYDIRIPEEVARAKVPPMMLLTLIENAIKHGINPLTQGGYVGINAARRGAFLELSVADSGRGMSSKEESGTGTGLANIRSRLQLLYGHSGQLLLAHGSARGVTATIRLPWQPC